MKNETNTPAPTGQDILEAKQAGWITLSKHKVAVSDWVNHPESVWYFRKRIDTGIIDLSWPEYYRLHCLSRPFKPEEFPESLEPDPGRGLQWRNEYFYLRKAPNGFWFVIVAGQKVPVKIPTAREYLALAGMLGIEVENKTESHVR